MNLITMKDSFTNNVVELSSLIGCWGLFVGRIYADCLFHRFTNNMDVDSHAFNVLLKKSFLYSASVPFQTVLSLLCFLLAYRMLFFIIQEKQKITLRICIKLVPLFLAVLYSVYWLVVLNPMHIDADVNTLVEMLMSSEKS